MTVEQAETQLMVVVPIEKDEYLEKFLSTRVYPKVPGQYL
jgi:hypothetical protein